MSGAGWTLQGLGDTVWYGFYHMPKVMGVIAVLSCLVLHLLEQHEHEEVVVPGEKPRGLTRRRMQGRRRAGSTSS